MAISNATRLSDFGSGIGTGGAILKVDNANQRVGIGTTNPQAMLSIGPAGNMILIDGIAGVISATGFVGGTFTGDGSGLTGVANTDYVNSISITATGIITANSFEGSGANLTGVSGFGTAVNATQGTLGNLVYKTPRSFYIGGGTSSLIESDTTSGGVVFTRLGEIHIGSASTVHIGSGTTLAMDVLSLF